ncbi:unnamed protein product, partial [Ectocarpus sp. 12 AP-2014]
PAAQDGNAQSLVMGIEPDREAVRSGCPAAAALPAKGAARCKRRGFSYTLGRRSLVAFAGTVPPLLAAPAAAAAAATTGRLGLARLAALGRLAGAAQQGSFIDGRQVKDMAN